MVSADSMQQTEQDRLPPQIVPSISLQFPTISVHGTPAGWLSHSQLIIMNSQHDDNSCDDTTSSLGDSSYDFVDDRSIATTDEDDQDAMTESITSNDEHDFDHADIRHLHSKSDIIGDQSSHSQTSNNTSSQKTQSASNSLSPERESSLQALQEQAPLEKLHERREAIEFVEPSINNLTFSRPLEVSHTLKVIDAQDAPVGKYYRNVLEQRSGKVAVNVKQTMASHGLQLRGRPYKIVYVGNLSMRDVIVQKIATSLAASLNNSPFPTAEKPRPSRFNIVPISAFGEETSPEVVLIDSSGLEMTIEECSAASFASNGGGNDTICMQLSDGTQLVSSWSSSKFVISNDWRIPDIAVIFSSERDSVAMKQTRRIARSFLSRHAVQTIVITEAPLWSSQADAVTLDYMTPHIHLESLEAMGQKHVRTVRRLPIDLATFLSIDADQMNRNLACLDAARRSSKSRVSSKVVESRRSSYDRLSIREIYDASIADFRKDGLKALNRYEYLAGFVMILMSVLGIVVVSFGLTQLLGVSRVQSGRSVPMSVASASTLSVSASTIGTATPLSLPTLSAQAEWSALSAPARVKPVRSLSTDVDIASLLDAYTLAPNKSEQFKVHVLGDCHVVLRPPHWFSKTKKAPKLLFRIRRGDKTLEHQVSTLFDGLYALQIPREDTYGVLNVAVWTESKPKIKENFEVDFGSSWFKVAGWKRAARALTDLMRRDLESVQTSLSIFYDHTKIEISKSLQEQRAKIAAQREAEKTMLRSHLRVAIRTKELVVAQTKSLIRHISVDLQLSHAAASNVVKNHAENITKDFIVFASNKTSMITRKSYGLARNFTRSNASAVRRLGVFGQRHVRKTQKKALQFLWKIGGAPSKKTVKAKSAGKEPSRNGKKFIRRDGL